MGILTNRTLILLERISNLSVNSQKHGGLRLMKKVMDRQTDFNNKIVIATICRLALAALIIANAPGCSNSDNFAGRQPMAEPPPNTATLPNQAAYSANPQGQYPQANYKYSPRNQQQQSNYYQGSNNNNDRRTYPNYQAARQASANQSPNYPQNQGQSYNPNHYSGTPQQNPNRTTSPANYNSQSAQYQQHPVNPSAPNQANYPAGIASNPSDISWQQVPRRPVTAGPNRASRPSQSPVVSNVSIAQNDGPQQNLPNYQSSGNFNAANSNNLPIQQNASRNGTLAQNPTNIPAANQISYSDNNLDKNVLRQQAADPSTLTITPSSQTLTVPPANQTPPTDLTQPALFVQKMPTAISRNNITDTLAALKHFVATHPENTNAVLALHYLYRCQNQTEQARQSLPQTTEQANQALKAITELETLLADKADLDIVNFKVCDKVLGFGQ